MEGNNRVGLTRSEILRQWEWAMKYPPKDPDKLIARLGEVLADILTKNNAAIAAELAARAPAEPKGHE